MKPILETLHIEDSEDDAFLVKRALESLDYDVVIQRVETLSELESAFPLKKWHLILSDFNVPGAPFNEILSLVQAHTSVAPIIMVTGALGEEATAEIMRMGVHDVVIKDHLKRLPGVVIRNLREAQARLEQQKSKEMLIESQSRYESLWENSSTSYLLLSDGHIVDCNYAACVTFGYEKGQLVSSVVDMLLNDGDDSYQSRMRTLSHGVDVKPMKFVTEHIDAKGNRLLCEVTLNRISMRERWLIVAAIRDITESTRMNNMLRLTDRALQFSNDGIIITVNKGKDKPIIWANAAFLRLSGYSEKELIGEDCRILNRLHRDQEGVRTIRLALQQNSSVNVVLKNFKKDGTAFWNQTRIDPVFDEEGLVTHFVGISRDVSEQVEREERLKRSESLLQETGEIAKVGAWEIFLDTNELYWSEMTRAIHEVDADYKPTLEEGIEFYHPEDQPRIREVVTESMKTGSDFFFEARLISAKNTEKWVKVMGNSECQNGVCNRVFGVIMDITQQKQNELEREELNNHVLQLQRLETIGTLAGGIAHDFNNILGAMRGWTELAVRHAEGNANVSNDLQHVLKSTERAAELVNQILLFSRESPVDMKPIDIKEVTDEAINMMRSTIPSSIEFAVHLDDDIGIVFGDAGQIQQVILNLITNARQAMTEDTGVITISLQRNAAVQADTVHDGPVAKEYACLTISDDGPGIAPEHLPHLFAPFYTTKPVGQGTGLGLSVAHGIVQSHEGTITVDSTTSQGASFTIRLPIVQTSKTAPKDQDSQKPLKGHERILLVDDEPELCAAMCINLEHLGYQVTQFDSSSSALEAYQSAPNEYDLIMTDQVMPTLKGHELAQQIRETSETLPIIIMTGFSSNDSLNEVLNDPNADILLKPCSVQLVTERIRSFFDQTVPVPRSDTRIKY